MSYFGNTLSIEVEENCRKMADTFAAGQYDAEVFMPVAAQALRSLIELHAYAGRIKDGIALNEVYRLLGLQPIPEKFYPASWLDDANIDKLKK